MIIDYRLIKKGIECREALKKGIDEIADIVKRTLGPQGRNAIIEKQGAIPRITNDGVTIAREIVLKDEFEDLGAQAIINVAIKTNQMVGDGTTTSVVLAQAIIGKVFEQTQSGTPLVGSSQNLMAIKREIDEACEDIVGKLKKSARLVKEKEEIEKVATISVEDEKMGKIIADMIDKVGKDGFISVDDSFKYETESEVVEGMKFYGKYAASFMMTNPGRKEAVFRNSYVLVTNQDIEDPRQLIPISGQIEKEGKKTYIIFAPKFSPEVLATIYATHQRARFTILGIKSASLTTDQLEDVACYTGARLIDKTKGMELENTLITDLGKAEKVIATDDETIIVGGRGKKKDVEERIRELKEQQKEEQDIEFQKKIERRIASLSGGVGVIKVGAKTDIEKHYKRLKTEDAVCATKAALEEGIVKGGGLALKDIADKLPKNNILKKPLIAPYEQIQENAGGKLKIEEVFDPLKVVRIALENACSLAGIMITTESAVAWKRRGLSEELEEMIKKEEIKR